LTRSTLTKAERQKIMGKYDVADIRRVRAQRRLAFLRDNAPRSLECHARLVHRDDRGLPLIPARHHMEWIKVLEDRVNFPYVAIIAPPGFAKSTWVTVSYASWRIGVTGGRCRIILASNTASQAYGFANGVRTAIEHPWYEKAYPGVRPDFDEGWTKDHFWVTGSVDSVNPTMLAVGIDGPVVGKRADEIILDDPTTFQQASSRTIMDAQRNWVKNTLIKRFPAGRQPPYGKNSRMVVVATRWGENDLIPTLEGLGFKILNFPALGFYDRIMRCPQCGDPRDVQWEKLLQRCEHCGSDERANPEWGTEPLWQEPRRKEGEIILGPDGEPIWYVPDGQMTQENLESERESDPIMFNLTMMGDATAMAGDFFGGPFLHGHLPQADVEGDWHDRVRASFDRVVQYVDTAGGKDQKRGDFFALATVGIRKGGEEVWVMDMERGRYAAPEQERAVLREAEEWDPDLVIIEDANEGRALYQRLVASSRLPIKAIPPTKSKEVRAIALSNAYKGGRVWHPEGAKWLRTYEGELVAFPRGMYDDQVDAVVGAYNASTKPASRIRSLVAP
jgi:predicted phage terminase large subunit-like protein